jgi:alginate O-acetyltransferase complex protein AlgI
MLFHSLQFLFFLPIVFAIYWSAAHRPLLRKWLLFAASLVFYMAWNPAPVVLVLFLSTTDWLVGRGMAKWDRDPSTRTALLWSSIVVNLSVLGLFKYADWLQRSVVDAAALVGVKLVYAPLGLILPVGLSFCVFQGLSYTIDVYRRDLPARRSWLDISLFMAFFPHVVAGPIVRASDFLPQIDLPPTLSERDGARALFRIATGMFKKLVIADFLSANLVDRVFAEPGNYSGLEVIVAVFAYTLQIYYDFSAYSDIAIGSAALFGYVLKENFDKPYLSTNLAEFWRRWHVSLGSWLRDYLYIPLGGSRGSRLRTVWALWVTMILGGVWHGADWRFVAWGAVHGVGLILTRAYWWTFGKNKSPPLWSDVLSGLVTFVTVVEARIVFRATDMTHAARMFAEQWKGSWSTANLSPLFLFVLALAVAGHLLPHKLYDRCVDAFRALPVPARAGALLALALVVKEVASFEVQPFIYFKF